MPLAESLRMSLSYSVPLLSYFCFPEHNYTLRFPYTLRELLYVRCFHRVKGLSKC